MSNNHKMNKVSTEDSKFDFLKWCLIGLIVVSGISANLLLEEQPLVYRALGIIFLAVCALLLCFNTKKGKSSWQFILDSRNEIRKVVWPARQETVQTTFIVVAMVLVMAVLLWIIDSLLFKVMSIFTG